MDIEYLLYLQQFRETVGSILTPLMNAVTKLSAGFLPIAMMCMIYWAFDRKAGRKILAGLGGGVSIAHGYGIHGFYPMVILKQQLPDIHFQVGIQRGQRLCSVEVDFGSWKKSTVSLQVCCLCWYF